MIQPEPEGSTQGYPLDSVEVPRYDSKGEKVGIVVGGGVKDGKFMLEPNIQTKIMFDESNANVLERFYTSAGNPVKEILLKLNLPDHRILKDRGEGT
ncbi:hypothetical protein Tco_0115006 [Tanacetum coccineum]